jgi:hypothetical protein
LAPAALLQNVLPAEAGAISGTQLKRLQSAALLDGVFDGEERAAMQQLAARVEPASRPALDAWLAAPSNPELALVRKRSAGFDTRLAALTKHAQPGDVIFWRDPRGGDLSRWLGAWSHVSLVLGDGKLLDTMSLEGVSISTPEAVLAKVERRMQARAFAIGRPANPLTATQLDRLGAAAARLQGRDYALVSRLSDDAARLSCSRSVYEALKAAGVDAAPVGRRLARNAVMPGDLMRGVKMVGVVDEAGAFQTGKRVAAEAWDIGTLRSAAIRTYDWCLSRVPALWRVVDQYQAAALRGLRRV